MAIEDIVAKLEDNHEMSSHAEATFPTARSSASFVSLKGSSFIFFGGEYFDSQCCRVFGETLKWGPGKECEWKTSTRKPQPKPRVGHATLCVGEDLYVMGGEYATRSQFYHFRDFWCLDTKKLAWKELSTVNGPSPRSGHRMVLCRGLVVLFGGFTESNQGTKYHNDVFIYSPTEQEWRKIVFSRACHMPSPRGGVVMASTNDGVFIYGGYSKLKDSDKGAQGQAHTDAWWLDLSPVFEDVRKGVPTWSKLSKRGSAPKRSGMAVVTHKSSVYVFGGVKDDDDGGLNMKSLFFNDVYTYDLVAKKWSCLTPDLAKFAYTENLSKLQRLTLDEAGLEPRVETPLRSKENKRIDKQSIPQGLAIQFSIIEANVNVSTHPNTLPAPMPRLNAAACVKNNYLYIFGGSLEIGNVTVVFDDCWKLSLKGTPQWEVVFPGVYWTKQYTDVMSSSSSCDEESDSDLSSSERSDTPSESETEATEDSDMEDVEPHCSEEIPQCI